MTIEEFKAKYPNVDVTSHLKQLGVSEEYMKELIVGNLRYFEWVNAYEPTMKVDELKAYMEWDLIQSSASMLSDQIEQANFDFFGKVLEGKTEMKPRWQRCLDM